MTISSASVLLVEDDPNDVLFVERAFQRAGMNHGVRFARDGEEAISYFSGDGDFGDRARYPIPALVLLDLKLPKLSGFDVLCFIRARQGLRRIPVLILTSSREKSDITCAYELGANAYLLKPAAFNDLLGLVRTIGTFWMIANQYSEIEAEEIHQAQR